MSDYIDRDAFIGEKRIWYCSECLHRKGMKKGRLQFLYEVGDAPCRACSIDDMISDLENYPAADVAPVVHGWWKTEILVGSLCSVCGKHPYPYQADSASDDYWKPSYCPNCGAKMDLEVE